MPILWYKISGDIYALIHRHLYHQDYIFSFLADCTNGRAYATFSRLSVCPCRLSVMPNTHCRRRRDSTVELNCVGGVYWIRNSWRQSRRRRVSTSLNNLPTTKSSCVVSAVCTHQSSVVTQFPIFCVSQAIEVSDAIMTSLIKMDCLEWKAWG